MTALTVFAVPKPFEGHIGVIQRNAIRSWKRLRPECEAIVFGDEEGCDLTAAQFGIEHVPDVARNELGTPLLDSVFAVAERRARFDLLCYVNSDIILPSDFPETVGRVSETTGGFLLVGRVWDLEVVDEHEREDADWDVQLRRLAKHAGELRPPEAIDYFVFPRGLIGPLPPFAVGRPAWDNWMVYRARRLRIPVIDATAAAFVIHQRHGYGHVKESIGDTWNGPEADRNRALLGLPTRYFSIEDATHLLTSAGNVRAPGLIGRIRARRRDFLASSLGYLTTNPRRAARAIGLRAAVRARLRR
jgi:hypothetical protein